MDTACTPDRLTLQNQQRSQLVYMDAIAAAVDVSISPRGWNKVVGRYAEAVCIGICTGIQILRNRRHILIVIPDLTVELRVMPCPVGADLRVCTRRTNAQLSI